MGTKALQCLMGISCQDFCMIAADMTATQSILILKNEPDHQYHQPVRDKPSRSAHTRLLSAKTEAYSRARDENKIHQISNQLILGITGDTGDRIQFSQFIEKNVQLYRIRNRYQLDTASAVHFTRKNLAESLRSPTPFLINLLIGGYGEGGGELYAVDYMAACVKVPYAVHGLGGLFAIGILDNLYKPTINEEEAYDIIKKCVHAIQQRLFLNLANFQVKVVNAQGVKTMPPITTSSFMP